MTDDDFNILRAEVSRLSTERTTSEYGSIPASIGYLEAILRSMSASDERADVYTLLISECSKARNDSLYIDTLRRCADMLANDPIAQIGLAFGLAVIKPELHKEALDAACRAVDLAKNQGRLVRYSATNMARIALILDDYSALQCSLMELVRHKESEALEDSGYEFDFIDRIDPHRCSPQLLAQYKALAIQPQSPLDEQA